MGTERVGDGEPLSDGKVYNNPYARNVWSMQPFDGKIFIGCGNFDNGGPGANASPAPIFALDPKTKKITLEWRAPDEQVDVFRIINGDLYVPGTDPTEPWDLGNWYRRKPGKIKEMSKNECNWEKHRNLPKALHTFDICARDGKFYTSGYGILESKDNCATFKEIPNVFHIRYYAFLVFPKNIYAVGENFSPDKMMYKNGKMHPAPGAVIRAGLVRYDAAKGFVQVEGGINFPDVFPKTELTEPQTGHTYLRRAWSFKDRVLYIACTKREQVGAYTAADGKKRFTAERIKHPAGWLPYYFAVGDDAAYLVCAEKVADTPPGGKWVNHVLVSADGRAWTQLLSFKCASFARSAAVLDGYLYFGLGANFKDYGKSHDNRVDYNWSPDELSPASGEIWRVKIPARKK